LNKAVCIYSPLSNYIESGDFLLIKEVNAMNEEKMLQRHQDNQK